MHIHRKQQSLFRPLVECFGLANGTVQIRKQKSAGTIRIPHIVEACHCIRNTNSATNEKTANRNYSAGSFSTSKSTAKCWLVSCRRQKEQRWFSSEANGQNANMKQHLSESRGEIQPKRLLGQKRHSQGLIQKFLSFTLSAATKRTPTMAAISASPIAVSISITSFDAIARCALTSLCVYLKSSSICSGPPPPASFGSSSGIAGDKGRRGSCSSGACIFDCYKSRIQSYRQAQRAHIIQPLHFAS